MEKPPADKIDAILHHLENLDRRDRLRTWFGLIRSLIGFIPLLVFLYGAWYFSQNAGEILQKIAAESAKQAAAYTTTLSPQMLQKYLQQNQQEQ